MLYIIWKKKNKIKNLLFMFQKAGFKKFIPGSHFLRCIPVLHEDYLVVTLMFPMFILLFLCTGRDHVSPRFTFVIPRYTAVTL